MFVNKTYFQNNSTFNFTNQTQFEENEKNILQLLPFILLGSFLIIVLLIVIVLCIKGDKYQKQYVEAVKSRKRGEPVIWTT
jgi:hypothetical protein